ncbi:MAG: LPS export ABC transporter permease LptF [Methylotenera sp.]|nr:LPS export ABC transporter permease LptF [Oligoflexia bacterium]
MPTDTSLTRRPPPPNNLSRTLAMIKPMRIDIYILGEILGPFIGGVIFFSFIFLMFQALRLAEFFIIHGVGGLVLLKMISLMILSFLPIALPVAFLIGILVGFGRLSADSELVAMKANGFSVWRLAAPVTLLAVVVVLLSLGLNMNWVPWGDKTFKSTLIRVSNTKVVSSIKEGTFTSGFFDLLLYADRVDPVTDRLQRVFIYDEREPRNPLTVVAKEGEILSVVTKSELGTSIVLKLYNGNIHRNDIESNTYQKIDFEEYRLFLKIEEGSDNATLKPRMYPYDELKKSIANAPRDSGAYREMTAELWRRYTVALSPLIFVFLGIGYGTVRTRAVRAGAALVALAVIVIYWSIQAGATVAVHKGILPPVFAMQLPNLAILLIAIKGFRSATW